MTVIGVRFKQNEKMYYFDPGELHIEAGQSVIVQTARGMEFGEVMEGNTMVADEAVVQPLKPVVRIATEKDLATLQNNKKLEEDAFLQCKEKIEARGLDMSLVSVECTFDRNKMLFYFTADGRIDFRELVRDLAGLFRTRIELRQIGVRDQAKMVGGLGICGRELCCSLYLKDFHPVSINMAKDQNLSLNPTKISGVCGRLMCCLQYEQEAYKELRKTTPRNGTIVETPEGRGKVVSSQILRGTCNVLMEDAPERTITKFNCGECCPIKSGGGGGCCRARKEGADNGLPTLEEAVEQERFPASAPKKDGRKNDARKNDTRKPPQQDAAHEGEKPKDGSAPKRRRRRSRGGQRGGNGGNAQEKRAQAPSKPQE